MHFETPFTKLLFQKAGIQKIPLSGTFELSPICNFDCRMCYVRQTMEQVKKIQEKCAHLNSGNI